MDKRQDISMKVSDRKKRVSFLTHFYTGPTQHTVCSSNSVPDVHAYFQNSFYPVEPSPQVVFFRNVNVLEKYSISTQRSGTCGLWWPQELSTLQQQKTQTKKENTIKEENIFTYLTARTVCSMTILYMHFARVMILFSSIARTAK